ncbi:hypothetical protein PIB30_037125 [Stylosanthes scabra]|uniref:Uncharacterized protein n=1 Tax=Stylosanthes scabra TaxID=79078 RepID=A0ABU6ZBU6_9FABA|nr:hypothetical protein [Stylosanthes scabra]
MDKQVLGVAKHQKETRGRCDELKGTYLVYSLIIFQLMQQSVGSGRCLVAQAGWRTSIFPEKISLSESKYRRKINPKNERSDETVNAEKEKAQGKEGALVSQERTATGRRTYREDQNTRRIILCRFWTSRRPRVRLKRKCINLGCKDHGFHEVTLSESNHKKSTKLIGFSSDSEIT